VEADLAEVKAALENWQMAQARTAHERAEGRVAGGGPLDLRQHVGQMREHLRLVADLEGIRSRKATLVDGQFDNASADRDYARLLLNRVLTEEGEDPGRAAERIQQLPVRAQLVVGLDDWALSTRNRDRRAWLLEVARRADSDLWSDRVRAAVSGGQRADLERLAGEPDVAGQPPQRLTALAEALRCYGADPVPLLKVAQRRHPEDFWLALLLGNGLVKAKPGEAIGHYRAALALRPDIPDVSTNLGHALQATGQVDEAIELYRRALATNSRDTRAHNNLGNALAARGQVDEAIAHYRQALALDSGYAKAHYNLAWVLSGNGQGDEAIHHYRQAIQFDPNLSEAHNNLGKALKARGQLDQAIEHYRQAVQLAPANARAHNNLGHALYDKGEIDEAITHYRQTVALEPGNARAHTDLGYALAARGDRDEAIQHYRQAIQLDPGYAKAHGALGQALRRAGRFAEARKSLGRCLELLSPNDPLREPVTRLLRQCERAGPER
jgi:tetratricopeptide (TPR) repeat protein